MYIITSVVDHALAVVAYMISRQLQPQPKCLSSAKLGSFFLFYYKNVVFAIQVLSQDFKNVC